MGMCQLSHDSLAHIQSNNLCQQVEPLHVTQLLRKGGLLVVERMSLLICLVGGGWCLGWGAVYNHQDPPPRDLSPSNFPNSSTVRQDIRASISV